MATNNKKKNNKKQQNNNTPIYILSAIAAILIVAIIVLVAVNSCSEQESVSINDNPVATITMEDGSIVEIELYPIVANPAL